MFNEQVTQCIVSPTDTSSNPFHPSQPEGAGAARLQMRRFQCLALCVQGAFSGGGDDFASAFNKAFFDQLQGANQAQVIEMVPGGSPPRGREAELDQQLQRMVGAPGYTVEFVNEDAAVPAESIRQLFPGPLQFDLMDDLPDLPWSEHPRPQLRRNAWKSLNGLWRCRISKAGTDPSPKEMLEVRESDQEILVPFCLESKLGGVQRKLDPEEELWYHRSFEDLNHLVVRVIDATGNFQARGKQSKAPHGIWYSRVSGIWQTVWLETVPATYISDLRLHTERLEPPCVQLQISVAPEASEAEPNLKLRVVLMEKENKVLEVEGNSKDVLKLELPGAKLWSPESPHLYDLQLQLLDAKHPGPEQGLVDSVQSYVGIRRVGKQQDEEGHWRMTLNGEMCFHLGPLDQGWWPDGLLTAPSDEAMRSDIEFLKEAGFNMIRKHVKLEPRRYYYHCDVLGIMVWQDQASATEKEGDCFKVPPWTRLEPGGQDAAWPDWARKQFLIELKEMVDSLHNSPAVVVWVPFNEAWGQHDTLEIAKWLQAYDPSRLLNIARRKVSDVHQGSR
eukprot:s2899_g4.t3